MKTNIGLIGSLVALIIAVGGIIWAAEDRYVDKGEALQTLEQMQQTLSRKDMMQDYEFLGLIEQQAREQYLVEPTEINKMEYQSVKSKRQQIKTDLGL